MIHKAGVFRAVDLFYAANPDDWWREIEVNVRGPYLFAQAVAPGMMARKRGRIINIASGAGTIAVAGASAYCVSKAALIRLTEQMAIELRDFNVVVLAYHPGTVRTPMNDYVLSLPQTERYAPWFIQLFEENRDVPIEEATSTLLAIASGAVDDLSGSFINVDDDLPALALRREEIQRDELRVLRMKF